MWLRVVLLNDDVYLLHWVCIALKQYLELHQRPFQKIKALAGEHAKPLEYAAIQPATTSDENVCGG